jgi:hypothetical protein
MTRPFFPALLPTSISCEHWDTHGAYPLHLGIWGYPRGMVPIGFWAKLKTPKTHHPDYQNDKFGVFSASLGKTLGVNQFCSHRKAVSAYHPWVSVISDPPGFPLFGVGLGRPPLANSPTSEGDLAI